MHPGTFPLSISLVYRRDLTFVLLTSLLAPKTNPSGNRESATHISTCASTTTLRFTSARDKRRLRRQIRKRSTRKQHRPSHHSLPFPRSAVPASLLVLILV